MFNLKSAILIGFASVWTTGCGRVMPLDAEISRTEIDGTLTAYVTSWLDLDNHFDAEIALSGAELGLMSRVEGGHHQIRCVTVLQYTYVSVAFATNPSIWYRYRVDCKHDQGTAN